MAEKEQVAAVEPEQGVAVLEEEQTEQQTDAKKKPKRQPRYHVILWNDDDHTYDYVVEMMQKLFGHPLERGFQIATQVDKLGKSTVLTTTREHAELKRDQIHAFGKDKRLSRCKGSMSATIEPET